jgi:hypothetical protein
MSGSIKHRLGQIKFLLLAFIVVAVAVGAFCFLLKTEAVQVKSLQASMFNVAGVSKTGTATINEVVPSQTILVAYNAPGAAASAVEYAFTVELSTPTEVYAQRNTTGGSIDIQYNVMDFHGKAFVQSGFTKIAIGTGGKNILLPYSVDVNKSFVLTTWAAVAVNTISDVIVSARLIDSNTLSLERALATNAEAVEIAWQVIEFEKDVNVQHGTTLMPAGGGLTATQTITSVDPNKALLIVSTKGETTAATFIDAKVCAELTDATTLTFTRKGDTEGCTVAWSVVEFADATTVQRGKVAGWATKTADVTISAVEFDSTNLLPYRAIPFVSCNSSIGDDIRYHMVGPDIDSATNLYLYRGASGGEDCAWQVVEFPSLDLTSPDGGELWKIGETQNITWTHAASTEVGGTGYNGGHRIRIEYSKDSGASFPILIYETPTTPTASDVDCTSDSYSWTLPETIGTDNVMSTTARIKIIDLDATTANYDTSDGDFEIQGTIDLTAPDGGEIWYVGDSDRNITWNYTGDFGTVALYYDTASGTGGYTGTIATGVSVGSGGVGSYNWNPIPDLNYETMRVKVETTAAVSPENYTQVSDASAADFSIRPTITITTPNLGTEVWRAQTNENIEWSTTGTIPSVNIYYSTNTGVDWTLIESDYTLGSPYTWTVPVEAIGDQTKIKVEKSDQAIIMDTAPDGGTGVFSIVASINVTSPNSGTEVWRVGETHNITWEINGSIANVKIEYSTDSGATYPVGNEIVASTPASDLSYPWTIPDNISDTVKVKISNVDDPSMFDESDNDFKIKGRIVVTSPDGGEVYTVGSSQVITWEKYGTIGDIDIKYSTDGGVTFPNTITATPVPAADLNYTWNPIPDSITDTARVKIELVSDPDGVFDASNADFAIKGSLTLTAPNGGETFFVGDTTDITWTYEGTIGNVELRYSTDGGSTFPDTNVIATGIAPTSSPYSWTVPDAIGSTVRVEVLLVSDPTVYDMSDANFSIKGNLVITAPNGGEIWEVDTYQNITWERLGASLGTVSLDYSINSGADGYPYSIATLVDSGALSYSWLIPDAIGNLVRVKITSEDDASINDASDGDFSIKGRFALSAPVGGETWLVGTDENITWTTYGTIGKVNLYYSTDGGATYPSTIVTAASNVDGYLWTIPDAIGTQVRVKVENYDDTAVYDTSPADFTIKGRVIVTAPDGGEVWRVGETQNVTWSAYGSIGNVEIRYSTDGGTNYPDTNVITPVGGVPATDGSFAWTIPDEIGTNLKIKITSLTYTDVTDESNNVFEIKGTLTLTAPDGGETFYVGDSTNITWTKTGTLGNVELQYSTDGGVTYPAGNVIATGIDAELGTPYSWTIPDAIGNQLKVKVLLTSDPDNVYDESNANFTIKGKLQVDIPNGGEVWEVASSQNITWTRTGSIANVELRYSTDGGTTYPNVIIASTDAAVGSYAWTIPDAIGTALRVKVTDASDATVFDSSDANFTIKGKLVVSYPNGGETLIVGSSYNITWNSYGTIPKVNLYYSTDSGTSFTGTIVTALDNVDSYSWTVPDAIGTQVRVKVENYDDSTVYDTSDADFTIKGSVTLTAPNGGETWIVGNTEAITWTKTGSIGNVELSYSTDGGATYPNVITGVGGVPSSDLSFAWTIPDDISTNVKVKIVSLTYSDVLDESDAVFSIKPSLTLTAPNGGEAWVVGSAYDITWTKTGTISTVKLEYSTNAFADELETVEIATLVDATTGTPYSWTIPDAISSTVKVRVTNEADTSVYDVSDTNFKIVGAFTLTAPDGGENWTVGSSYSITWNLVGSIADAKIEYSTDSGASYPNIIVSSTPAGGLSYSWTIPDTISSTVKVKISDVSDATVFDGSNADFNIIGGFTITAPNGGEVWVVGSAYDITWSTSGTVANVKLEYSTDGGSTYPNVIVASAANVGSYSWTVPDDITTSARIRVSDASNADAFDTSDGNFKIRAGLTLTAPNGGEDLLVGTSQDITWTKTGTISTVKLEYSTDGGATYPNTIATLVDATTGTPYVWTIPDDLSTTCKVKVTNEADSTVFDESDNDFTIKGALTLTAPNGAEAWIVGTTENITWTQTGSIANVKLEYSTDSGLTYPNLIVSSTPSDGSYAWGIPDSIGSTLRVQVTDVDNTNVFDTSDADFSIKGSVTVTAPNGGETWIVGENRNITWTKSGSIANVMLEYSTNAFADELETVIITSSTPAADLSYAWTVPDAIDTDLKVRISDVSDATVVDVSDSTFIIKGALALTSPNGGEVWIVDESRNITWNRTGSIANVKLEYSTDAGVTYANTIVASTDAAAGSYAWTIPDAIGNQLRVRVTDTSDATVYDESDANFEIKGSLTLTAPNGGEAWVVGSAYDITWTKTGTISTVKLEYSTNAFADELETVTIATAVDASLGTPYSWTIPDAISSTVKVRVTNEADTTVYDVSDTNFKIVGSFTLTAPDGGENWTVGSSYSITWNLVGSIADAKIEYSTDSGASYPNVIVASTPAGGLSYAWTIPDTISSTVRVKISDVSDATVFDESNADFNIIGGFTITAPNGGEVWTVGDSQSITWNTAGSVADIKLEYSTDGGSTYPNVIIATTPNTGSYSWTIPDSITTTAKVKVSDASNANAYDTSDANFKIRGAITVTAPNGGEEWAINTTQDITWTIVGSISTVKLEYSTNGFADELETYLIASAVDASLGTPYSWLIPDTPSASCKVRITNEADSTVYDLSNNTFSIKGSLWVTAPNGAEVWIVGDTNNITWDKFGAIATVELRYSTDSGTTWPLENVIATAVDASLLSYSWTIPDAISATVRVKIIDEGDATVFDESDADFSIKGSVTVTSPDGGEVWIVGETRNITWSRTGSFANVMLEYSTNAFADELETVIITSSTPAADLSYAWTVPDAIDTDLKVRISDSADSTVVDVSNGTFTIKGALALTSPNGGEVWIVGDSRNITWNRTGSIANVKLEYSTDAGINYPNTITTSTDASTGTYAWTIPDAIGTQLRVRVTDASDATVFDTSDANFEIKGSLTLTAPNGGEAWVVGSAYDITWTKTGTISTVTLEYSTNAFADELETVTIATAVDASLGTPYSWTIPDAISSTVKVRITNEADAAVTDRSDTNFKIVGSFTLTAPDGAEQWTVGTTQSITWTMSGSIADAKLEYSTDGGASYPNVIVASTPAGGLSYSWTIPDTVSTTAKVKISDASDATVYDESNANFAIRGGFAITAPNGGEVWVVGTSENITWTTTGSVADIKLEYSTDGGTTYPNVIVASTPNAGSYAWTIPDTICATAKVRISDVNNDQAYDTSDNNFKIRGALTLTAPNGGEQWVVGTTENITWTTTGTITDIKLEYSTNGFADELETVSIVTSTPNTDSYAWTIPDAISSTVKVRITNVSDSTVYDLSNNNFTIIGSLTLTAPNGGEIWIVGDTNNITWSKVGSIANVELEYSTNAFADELETVVITTSTPAVDLSYAWSIPDAIGTNLKVRITDVDYSTVTDISDATFEIKGSLTLTAPNGGEIWIVGESRNITWNRTGSILNAKLEYSTNGFADELQTVLIIDSTDAATGSYAWTIPDAIGTSLKVRITNVADSAVTDTSDANFEIKGSLTVSSPNGGEVWIVDDTQPITWSKSGSIANVKIEYSTDGGSTYPNVIVASTDAGAGSYSWTIPDTISTTVKVKITNVDDTAVFDTSDANFKIAGSLTLTAPNGGEAWLIGSSENITWTKTGSIANVKLEYSTNAFADETQTYLIASSVDATLGTPYAWTIPDTPSTTVRVRITNTADATVYDISDADFRIRGSLTITSPNGGEIWIVGESRDITWTRVGSIANAKLEYSTDGGTNYPNVIVASTPAADLSYAWTVPDAIGTSLRVKITDVDDTAVTDASDANFEIKGSLTLTSPNGGEVWVVGESRDITWTKTGSIVNVMLEYSTNGFADELETVVITSSTDATTGSYAWTVADAITTTLKVRITNTVDSVVTDMSDANFEIKGSLTLTAPNGGETWIVGSSYNITWTRTGSIANVQLDYSTDGGLSYLNSIVLSTDAATGSYAWTIPDEIGTALRVKITNVDDSTVSDTSDANFKIAGSFTLSAPNGGEVWIVDSTENITWTITGSIADAMLEYSTDGGVNYPNLITSSVPADLGSYTWTIPDNISSTVKVRITDVSDSTVFDESDANFKIAGSFTLTAPNGGEKWPIGSTQAITWSKTGSIANAKLEYSTDGGTTYPNVIIATTPAADLSYNWTIPDDATLTARVKITDVSDSTVFDTSDADFKIHGTFNITAPNGGEVWVVGESRDITWTTNGSIANVKLEYSVDGGTTYPNTIISSTTNTGSYSWTVPDEIGTTLRVKITDVNDPDATDTSDANFKIRGDITVTSPDGGEIWIVGETHDITWTIVGSIANVKLEYSTDGGTTYPVENLIASSVDATLGTPYAWIIPDAISTTVKVRITDVSDATVYDESNNTFTIRGGFTLTAPNGGEKWTVGTTQTITWDTFGTVANVKLDYSIDSGVSYPNAIISSTSNVGSYNWTIPNSISSTVRVRVSDAADPGSLDDSDADFKIMGGFTISAPNGGEVWVVGSSENITWTTAGTVDNVKLEYSTDGGTTYPNVITLSTPNTNAYAWVVPDAISATVRVRVSDASDADAYDTSDANFKIRAGFTLTSPDGGEAWVVGTTENITWTTFGTVDNIKLEYSTDSGATYPNVIIDSTPNAGSYAWTIPDAISTAVRVRVSDVNDLTASDTSNSDFKIQGSLIITSPNGGEKWTVGTSQTISWDRAGSIGYVKLEYSTDGGTIYAPIVDSTSNTGSYGWTIPDDISTTVRVRITDTNDATVFDTSDADFKIQAGFNISSPNGGEVWLVGSSQDITWTTQGTVGYVKLEYSTDGGTTYPNEITSSVSNTGTYSWTVPDSVSGTVRVRVVDTSDPEAYDESNSNFRIRATFTLTSPNGGQQWLVGDQYDITWSVVGTIPDVKLQYSRDGFLTDIQTIAALAPTGASSGTYTWTIPDSISDTVRVRVSDPNDSGAYDDSNADFRITARFTVTAPNGGEKWDVGSTQDITWTWAGTVPDVTIEYSVNGGATYPNIITATSNTGSYSWLVPDDITAEFKVRISDLADSTAYDVSDANAKIKAPFTLTSPNGGEILTVSDIHTITWTWQGTVPDVQLDYSTDDFTTTTSIVATTSNTGSYDWTIPDAISTTVKVRVMSTTDTDAYDISDDYFKIRGAFVITAPNGGEQWKINQTNDITWTTIGTISDISLVYSTDSGATYPNTIVATTPNTNSYSWTIPDTPSATARVKIINVSDTTVYDESDSDFRIQGYFTVTSPNGGEAWIVGTQHDITWDWGGTIPSVKISYSKDSGVTFPNVIDAAAPNGAGGGGSYSYTWTIPDDICSTVRVKVEDPNDDTVYDISDADLKIRGDFVLTSPNGGERWVTNETHSITWTTTGTISNVKLEYSKDDFATWAVIVSSTTNTNTYDWVIPDDRSTTVKVRVLDATDDTVYDTSDANFKIDYYTITWEIRDLLTNEPLTNLSVTEKITGTETIGWQESGLTSPVTHDTPYENWTATWSCSGYGDKAQKYAADSDQSFTLYLETTAIHIWRAEAEFTYDADQDNLKATSWLERDGMVVSGAIQADIYIYDETPSLIKTMTSTNPSEAGYFNLTWSGPTGLQEGVVYSALVDITNAAGAHFKTPTSFSITEAKRLQQTEQAVYEMRDTTLPQFQTDVETLITEKMDEQTKVIVGEDRTAEEVIAAGGMVGMIEQTLTSFEERTQDAIDTLQAGAEQAVEAGQTLSTTAQKYSWDASLSPNPALTNDMITLSVQGPDKYKDPYTGEESNPAPMVSIYSWDNIPIVENWPVPRAKSGLYVYTFKADDRFEPGKAYTYIVSDHITGGLISGSGLVESVSLTTIEGLVSQTPMLKSGIDETLEAVKAVEAVIGTADGTNIILSLQTLQESIEELPEQIAKEGPSGEIGRKINEIAERLVALGAEEGFDFSDLIEEALGDSPTIKAIRSKTDAIQAIVQLLQMLFEAKFGGLDTPVVSTTLAPGSVRFRVIAANPSKTKTQSTQVKVYLPEEVTLEDIIDLRGLEVEYDPERGMYYAYKNNVVLAPSQVRTFEVEVEDVWIIPEEEINDIRAQAEKMVERFKDTNYYDRAKNLGKNINILLDEIIESQSDETISRQQHIGIYRQNKETIKRIKDDMAELEELLQPAFGPATPEVLEKSRLKLSLPSKTTTWLIILTIVVFLGLLAGVFFFVWQKQVRASQELIETAKKSAFPEQKPEQKTEEKG